MSTDVSLSTGKTFNMSDAMLKCGLIGTGAFAKYHASALSGITECSLFALYDKNENASRSFATEFGGTTFMDLKELLQNGGCDILTIATPDETHADLIKEILGSDNPPRLIIVEKPLCTTTEEYQEISDLVKKKDAALVVNHVLRFDVQLRGLKTILDSGELGKKILDVNWRYYGGWFRNGIHAVDIIQILLGELTCNTVEDVCIDRYENDPLLTVTLSSESYPNASIRINGIKEDKQRLFEGEITLDQGRIRMVWDDVFIDKAQELYAGKPKLKFDRQFQLGSMEDRIRKLYRLCAAWIREGDSTVFKLAGLDTLKPTMDILFDAHEKATL